MNYSTSIVGTTFVESLLWPPTAFLQTLWEQPFPQSLWERYTLTNHAGVMESWTMSKVSEFF